MASCGEALIQMLEGYGIETVFGIPGVHTVDLYRGLANSHIKHVTPRHEQGAGFMADGYYRASGKVAACFIITGPGMTNIVTAMGQALADSIPMLVISAVNETHQLALGRGRLHELPSQHNLVSGVARFSHTLMRTDELPEVLARAFSVFQCQRPGPVHIEIPLDVIRAAADHVAIDPMPLPASPAASPQAIERAAALLLESQDTVLLVGGGAIGAHTEVTELAELLGAAVINTVNAKGVIATDHELSIGGSPSLLLVRERLQSAQLVLAIGTEFGETDYDYFYHGDVRLSGTLIRIDIDAQQLMRSVVADLAICADASLALRQLLSQLESQPVVRQNGAVQAEHLRQQLVKQRDQGYQRFFQVISESFDDVTIVGDSTQTTYYAWLHYECAWPRRYFHSASGFGTLGYAIPAAIGASLALPDKMVISLIGDGASMFTIGELACAVEQQVNTLFIVWNNYGYGEIKRSMESREVEPIGVDVLAPDFPALAKAFGCYAARPATIEEFKQELADARQRKIPSLIEIVQDDFSEGYVQFA